MFRFSFSIITLIIMFSEQLNIIFCTPFYCKALGDATCLENYECCSNFCFKYSLMVKHGQCREPGKALKYDQISKCAFPNFLNGTNTLLFDNDDAIAIHKTLPINSLYRVFLETGASVVVRVIENGPFGKKNTLDLSNGAARRLGIANVKSSVLCEVVPLNSIGCGGDYEECYTFKDCCSLRCIKEDNDYGECAPFSSDEETLLDQSHN